MSVEIWIAILGSVTSIASALIGWLVGRRKSNAEAGLLEVDKLDKIGDFYDRTFDNTNRKLEEYIRICDANRNQILLLQQQIMELTTLIYDILTSVSIDAKEKDKFTKRLITINSGSKKDNVDESVLKINKVKNNKHESNS